MSKPYQFATAQEAKEAGWFSRRHQDSYAHQQERFRQDAKRANKGKKKS